MSLDSLSFCLATEHIEDDGLVIVAKWLRNGETSVSQRGGDRPRKVDGETLDFYLMLIEDDPTVTLKRMNETVRAAWPEKPHVATATISRAVHGLLAEKHSGLQKLTANKRATSSASD